MNNCDKFTLNWTGYDTNFKECFRKLREDKRMFDVTLATDDSHHIQAHRIILSAGSNFFSDIFMQNNQSSMLVYLKGIASDNLESVIDFIYNGEAFIPQDNLKEFIEIGNELKVKGLEGELTGTIGENRIEIPINQQKTEITDDNYSDEKDYISENYETATQFDGDQQPTNENEPGLQVKEMVEKKEGVWICKVCDITSTKIFNIKRHAERHIKGKSHACNFCDKIFLSRPNLAQHISGIHSDL